MVWRMMRWQPDNRPLKKWANAGHRSAVIYTLIESCRRCGLDPFAYLKDVLTRLPKATNWNIGELTPAAWAAAQKRVAACAA
jgi:transposase